MCVERSRAQLLFLCAEPHRQSCLDRFGTLRPGERLLSSDDVKENSEAMSYCGLRNPNAAVAAAWRLGSSGAGGVGLRSRIPRALLAAKSSGLPVQAVLSARARLHAVFNAAEVKSVGGYIPNLWHCLLDFAQDPDTDILEGLHSGVPLQSV